MSGFTDGFNAWTQSRNTDEAAKRTKLAYEEFAKQQEEIRQQRLDAGKAAEYFFKANPEAATSMGLHEKDIAGMSWSEKAQAAQGFIHSQAQKQIMQQLAAGQQQQQADAAFGQDISQVYGRNAMATLAQGNGPVNPPPVSPDALAAGLSPQAWQSKRADNLLNYHLLAGQNNDPAKQMNAEANYLNAQANMANAKRASTATPADYPAVNGYTLVPDRKGGYTYLRTQPSAQQQVRINSLSDQAGRLNTQISAYEAEINAGNKKPGMDWIPGETYEQKKAALESRLASIQAELADLKNGQASPNTPAAAPARSGNLWEDFMNFQK
jgi:hypothetical protein